MAVTLTANNQEKVLDLPGNSDRGYRCAVYTVTGAGLSGGTLRFWATIDGLKVPIPNSKLTASKNDDNGDLIQMISFSAGGIISVQLTGAGASPNVTVAMI